MTRRRPTWDRPAWERPWQGAFPEPDADISIYIYICCDFNIYSFSILNSPVGVAADVMFLHVSQQRGFNKCLVATYRPERGVCAHGELKGKYPEPAARSLGGTVLFAIGVAIVIEVQGTILLQIFLLLLPDSILVDPIINIIPWKFRTNCGHSALVAEQLAP